MQKITKKQYTQQLNLIKQEAARLGKKLSFYVYQTHVDGVGRPKTINGKPCPKGLGRQNWVHGTDLPTVAVVKYEDKVRPVYYIYG